eukprot:jgi/Mesvir1/17692/Mv07872-RA.1
MAAFCTSFAGAVASCAGVASVGSAATGKFVKQQQSSAPFRAGHLRASFLGVALPAGSAGASLSNALSAHHQAASPVMAKVAGVKPIQVKDADYAKTFGTTLVVGANRGLGLAITQLLTKNGCDVYATCRTSNKELDASGAKVVTGIDMLDDKSGEKLVAGLKDAKFKTLMVVAGYFTTETWEELNFDEERKMFEICSIAPLRITQALWKAGKLPTGSTVGLITSEGGSIGLRTEKEGGANYGHHMSKCASNMCGKLMAWDLKPHGVAVVMLHPGFLKTDMTQHYSHLYEELGAMFAHEAAPVIMNSVAAANLDNTGRFIAPFGAKGLGLGVWALEDPDNFGPGSDLPW